MLPLMVAVTALASFGINRIKVDDSLTELFRTSTPEFQQYESLSTRFPSSEYDVLVVVEGKDLLARDKLERLRTLATDLQLVDSVNGLVSMFSARTAPETGKIPPPLFPDESARGRRLRRAHRRGARQRDHQGQAALRGRRARPHRHGARPRDGRRGRA